MKTRTAVLGRILDRETHSLLQYLHDATPWTPAGGEDGLVLVHRVAAEERKAYGRIAAIFQRLRAVPPGGCYPERYSETHFLAIDYLLPKLVREQEKGIATLQADLHELTDADDRAVAGTLLDLKHQNLGQLRHAAAAYAGRAVSTKR